MVRALRAGRPQPMPPDFLLHLNELTLLIQRAGRAGISRTPTTSFAPIAPMPDVVADPRDYRASHRPRLVERALDGLVEALHKR
jgi:hypothetical protein